MFKRNFKVKEKVPEIFDFLKEATPKQKFKFGVLMWAALYLGYFTFCLNWIIFSNLEGSGTEGWSSFFRDRGLGSGAGLKVKSDAVNYGITLARGLATIGVAWFMTKFSHKKASVIALGLNSIALPLIFSPHYSLLVIGRMFMATGGTMLIILVQPVISKFFDLKTKGVLSALTPTAYILAALLANALFIYEGSSESVLKLFRSNWKLMAGICAGLSFLPWFAYIYFGKNFETADNLEQQLEENNRPENTYAGIIKEKSTWFWSVFYSFLLVASLLVSLKVPKILEKINGDLVKQTFSVVNISWGKLYVCFFYAGCLAGMCLGKWAKTKYQRKPMIALCCSLGLFFWLMIFGCSHITSDKALATTLIYWSAFFFAFFAMGVQAIILYVPHEYAENRNVKRLTIFFAYLWGIGYIIYTIYQIIVVSFIEFEFKGGSAVGPYIALGLITFFVLMFAAFAFTIKESRPEYRFFPGLDKASDIWKILGRGKNRRGRIY